MSSTTIAPASRVRTTPQARFSCSCTQAGGATHVTVTGELDIATVPELDRALHRADATLVVLDCRALEFIDSSGAHLLVATDRRIRKAGGRFVVVVRRGDEVEWLLALTGVDREVELTYELPAARAA